MKNKNCRRAIYSTLRNLIVLAAVVGLVNLGTPRIKAGPPRVSLKSESQVKSEAGLYDAAIREISRVETMKLTTADDFNRLKALLERHVPNLKFSRSKLVAIALSEAALISAAKTRTSNQASTDEFARELAADSQSIFRLSGGTAAKDKINRSVEADITMLNRVAEKVRRAAAEFKDKSPDHHPILRSITEAPVQRTVLRTTLTTVMVASLVISAVMIACPPLALAIPVLTAAAIGGFITAAILTGASVLFARVSANVGTEEGRDRLGECIEVANRKYDTCVTENPLVALTGGCLAAWLIDSGICLVTD